MIDNKAVKTDGLATAALILAILGALGFIFVFPPFVFGATAVALGLLSGTREGMTLKAKIAVIMGALSMVMFIVCVVSAVRFLMSNPEFVYQFRDTFQEIYDELENSGSFSGRYDFT